MTVDELRRVFLIVADHIRAVPTTTESQDNASHFGARLLTVYANTPAALQVLIDQAERDSA